MVIPRPIFSTPWGTGDTTVFLDEYITGLRWNSFSHGKADELEFSLDNSKGLFTTQYVPLKGDDVFASIGYDSGPLAGLWDVGKFVLDEWEAQGPPDSVIVRALSTSTKTPVRQTNWTGYENQTLREVLTALATRSGLFPSKITVPNIALERVTQKGETDLAFASRLARRFGCICKVEDGCLVVHPVEQLFDLDAVALIGREDVARYGLRQKLSNAAPHAVVPRFLDPETKELIGGLTRKFQPIIASAPDAPSRARPRYRTYHPQRADVIKIEERFQDKAHAEAQVRAALARAAIGQVEGSITLAQGDPRLRAGATVVLEGFGVFDGLAFLISEARHNLSRSGAYTTAIQIGLNPQGAKNRKKLKDLKTAGKTAGAR